MALKNGRTTAALQTILVGSVIPPGVIQAFGGGTVPSGWLLCDGSTASRSTYAGLFAAVGVVHGEGNGTTTFHLPDLRGRFLRGADNMGTGAAGRDPDAAGRTAANTGGATGDTVGSVQNAAAPNITGSITTEAANDSSYSVSFQRPVGSLGMVNEVGAGMTTGSSSVVSRPVILTLNASSSSSVYQATTEARPQNANSSFIIKV